MQNGYIERFNGKFRDDCLKVQVQPRGDVALPYALQQQSSPYRPQQISGQKKTGKSGGRPPFEPGFSTARCNTSLVTRCIFTDDLVAALPAIARRR